MWKFQWMFVLLFISLPLSAKTVRYELTITRGGVNLSGERTVDWALMVNGGIPAPTLKFTEGDDAEILVKNGLSDHDEVSIHWHGILLPPSEDGVAYINTPPIFPGQSRTFKFKIRQHGTYWYHSHTMLQEQKGVFGAIVIAPAQPKIQADREVVAILNDWTDENPDQVLHNLRKDGDYYQFKKKTVRSIAGAARAGQLGTYWSQQWERMGGMDPSDVGYDAFLINGQRNPSLGEFKPGEKIRIRLINAAASTYFHVALGDQSLRVISADGLDIQPIEAKEIQMGMAETFDVLWTVPKEGTFELRATAVDGTGFASAWLGRGPKVLAPDRPAPDLYAPMSHGGGHSGHQGHATSEHGSHANHGAPAVSSEPTHGGHANHEQPAGESHATGHEGHGNHSAHDAHAATSHHSMEMPSAPVPRVETLTVDDLKAQTPMSNKGPIAEAKLVLGGDMSRYVWHINGKTIQQDQLIQVREGDRVRFIFENQTMMNHPMHLHGHFFRVLTSAGDYSPLKHTVDVPPHSSRTIEFVADEPGQWMLHCHNLYHMKTGMARVVKYVSYQPDPELAAHAQHDPHLHDHLYYKGLGLAATNLVRAEATLLRTWDEFSVKAESRNDSKSAFDPGGTWDGEGDLLYRRWLGNYGSLLGGATLYHEKGSAVAGFGLILPLLIESQVLINHEGRARLDLEKRLQWTTQFYSDLELVWRPAWDDANHAIETSATLMYGPAWNWSAGLVLTNESVGAGAQFKF